MRLQLHLARQLLSTTALCAMALLSLTVFVRFSRYLDKALEGDIVASGIAPILLWRLPDFLSQLLPFSLLVGTLLCLWRMRDNGELMSLGISGVHAGRLFCYWLLATLPVAALAAACSLYLAPMGLARVEAILSDSRQLGLVNTLHAGAFHRQRNLVVHAAQVRRRANVVELEDIFLAETHSPARGMQITTADSGFIQHGRLDGFQLLLRRGATYSGLFESGPRSRSSFAELRRDIDNPWRALQRSDDAEMRPTATLHRSDVAADRAALHLRLSVPIMTLMALLLAMSAGLGRGIGSKSGARTLSGFLAALCYLLYIGALGVLVERAGAGALPVWPLHWPLHAVALVVALLWPGGAWRLRRL